MSLSFSSVTISFYPIALESKKQHRQCFASYSAMINCQPLGINPELAVDGRVGSYRNGILRNDLTEALNNSFVVLVVRTE